MKMHLIFLTNRQERQERQGKSFREFGAASQRNGIRVQKRFLHSCGKSDASLLGKGKIPNLSPFPLPLFPTSARSLLCKRKTKIAGNSVWLMLLMPKKYFPQDVPDYNAIAWLEKI